MKKLLVLAPTMTWLVGCYVNSPTEPTVLRDITNYSGSYSAKDKDFVAHEGIAQLFDASLQSKFLSEQSESWVRFEAHFPEVLKEYSLTSAQDAPMRDPASWTLEGSNDAVNWHVLDKQSAQRFENRGETKRYTIENNTTYRFYRLNMKSRGVTEWGDNYLQLADLALFAETKLPIVNFSIDKPIVNVGEKVTLTSAVANQPSRLAWSLPEQELVVKGKTAEVHFDKPGSYTVSLEAFNDYGSDMQIKANAIKVLDSSSPWKGFVPAQALIKFEDTESEGAKRLARLFPDLQSTINEVTMQLVPMLYRNFTEVPEFKQVTFELKWMDTIAYRSGDESNMIIAFSSKYITEKLKDQPDEQVKYELLGVLWHELTHGYQLFPKGHSYSSPEAHAFIEGMADLIRIDAGFHKTRQPKPSDSWLGGYTNTGFFLHWLQQKHGGDFAYQFNKTAIELEQWSFPKAIQNVMNEPLDSLWSEYQVSLKK